MGTQKKLKRVGFIARIDDTGLGVESSEFVEHFKPEEILKVSAGKGTQHPDRFPGETVELKGEIPKRDLEAFLSKIDVLYCHETPYHPQAFAMARKMGVKSVLRVNYEYLDSYAGENRPDLYIAPVDWYLDRIPSPKVVIPFPVDTKKIKDRRPKVAKTFVHVAGHRGYLDRNGTAVFLEAIPLVKSPARFIIYDQMGEIKINDKRVEVRGAVENYWNLYDYGDVLVMPRRHSGQSLPMQEAMAAGMAVMMTDMAPQNKVLPKEMLIPVRQMLSIDIKRRIEYADIDPAKVAEKIDEWYNKPIWQNSKKSRKMASASSWTALLPKYREVLM